MTRYVLFALVMPILVLVRPAAVGASSSPERHFVVFAAQSDVFHDRSGPSFVMLIKTAADAVDVGAVGIHAVDKTAVFGAIPEKTYSRFLDGKPGSSDVMLRLEVNAAQYDKVLAVLKTWDRRARERVLLYPDLFMNNVMFVKRAAEALKCCGGTVDLYELDWGLEDTISEHNIPSRIPFQYFKELRRLNESRHVRDADMPKLARDSVPAAAVGRR